MTKGIVYYTDNNLNGIRLPAFGKAALDPLAKNLILRTGLPLVSVSLKPIENFGKNIVLDKRPSVVTMTEQILAGLEVINTDYVFFCEHDILYHPSHFKFTPLNNETFFYNSHSWKWDYGNTRVVTHDHMVGLYGMCASREKFLNHYRLKVKKIYDNGFDKQISHNPSWMRKMGYEPGKPVRKGGLTNEQAVEWKSEFPTINVRHRRTITPRKMDLADFIHQPTGFRESTIDKIWPENDFKTLLGVKFKMQ